MAWTQQVEDTFTGSFTDQIAGRTPDTQGSAWGADQGTAADWVIDVTPDAIDIGASGDTWILNTTALADKQAAEVVMKDAQGIIGVGVRLDASGNGYMARWDSRAIAQDLQLSKISSGTFSSLGSYTSANGADGDVLRIEVDGTSLTVLINGSVVIGPTTDATYSSGNAGMWTNAATNGKINSFKAFDEAADESSSSASSSSTSSVSSSSTSSASSSSTSTVSSSSTSSESSSSTSSASSSSTSSASSSSSSSSADVIAFVPILKRRYVHESLYA